MILSGRNRNDKMINLSFYIKILFFFIITLGPHKRCFCVNIKHLYSRKSHQPLSLPPPPPRLHTVHRSCTQQWPFYFPNRISLFPKIMHMDVFFSKFSYPLLKLLKFFVRSGIRNSLLSPHPVVLVFANHKPTLVIIIFQHFLPVSLFLAPVTLHSHIPSQDDLKPTKQTSYMPTV